AITPAQATDLCLTAADNADGAAVTLEACTGDASQAWKPDNAQLVIHGDKCLDVTEGVNEKGTKLQIWSCVAGGSNQMFTSSANNHIEWLNFDKCLDVTNGQFKAGTPVQIWQCSTTTKNQSW
ncbi:ricin B lectin, partial [Exidia glandulosa HHB12029]